MSLQLFNSPTSKCVLSDTSPVKASPGFTFVLFNQPKYNCVVVYGEKLYHDLMIPRSEV